MVVPVEHVIAMCNVGGVKHIASDTAITTGSDVTAVVGVLMIMLWSSLVTTESDV